MQSNANWLLAYLPFFLFKFKCFLLLLLLLLLLDVSFGVQYLASKSIIKSFSTCREREDSCERNKYGIE